MPLIVGTEISLRVGAPSTFSHRGDNVRVPNAAVILVRNTNIVVPKDTKLDLEATFLYNRWQHSHFSNCMG